MKSLDRKQDSSMLHVKKKHDSSSTVVTSLRTRKCGHKLFLISFGDLTLAALYSEQFYTILKDGSVVSDNDIISELRIWHCRLIRFIIP